MEITSAGIAVPLKIQPTQFPQQPISCINTRLMCIQVAGTCVKDFTLNCFTLSL
ncbi:MAG TPA: hypothetical protein VJ577_07155 [Burkholderiaceae bacterium]|nr:hypothetical protein [Burkholderiaceae bacterium]